MMTTGALTRVATGEVENAIVEALRTMLRGEVIDRTHPAYNNARRVWNGLIDRFPAVIARCTGTADVVEAVRVARKHRPLVSIRGGGHQVAGSAVCDDGLVIDLSEMRAVHVDPVAHTVRVQAGATWADVDRETQLFGLVTPGGEVSQTGVAGLTLGGGLGALMRAHGLSCDNLRSIEIVTADGAVRTASREEHADLFWAARGGGRGLGVVTSFEFTLQPLGPQVAVAQVFYPHTEAARVLRAWRDLTPQLPDTVTPEFILWSIPSDPAIPADMHGSKAVIVAGLYAGDPREATAALAPLAALGTPLMDLSATMDYVAVQSAVDAAVPPGGRYFFKSHFMDAISDPAIDVLLDCDARRPNPESLIIIRALGGAIARVAANQSAFPHRSAQYNLSIDACWFDPALDGTVIDWARSSWDAMRAFGTGGVYLNFAGLDEDADSRAMYGWAADRLHHIQATYDPQGLFAAAAQRA
jgi:FAD/FMN-containing dehydrogenase